MRRGATSRPPPKPPHLPRGLSRASDNKSPLTPAELPMPAELLMPVSVPMTGASDKKSTLLPRARDNTSTLTPAELPKTRARDKKSTLVTASVPLEFGYTSDEDVNFHDDDDTAGWDVDTPNEDLDTACSPSPVGLPTLAPAAPLPDISTLSPAQLGAVFGQEAILDAILEQHDLPRLQQSFDVFLAQRKRVEQDALLARHTLVEQEFIRRGLVPPTQPPTFGEYGFNVNLQRTYSEYLRHRHGTLGDLIKLHRGQTPADPRPNKALVIPEADFPQKDLWRAVVQHGVIPKFKLPLPLQTQAPKNHKSWSEAWHLVMTDIAKGQNKDEYLILDGNLLPWLMETGQVFVSPFGAAEKQGKPITECARIVHDESFPRKGGISLNAATDKIPTDMKYDGVKAIASWALRCHERYPGQVVMMTGDVAGAFRNVPFAAEFCGCFCGYIPELDIIVINLVLPFGWTDAPAYYWLAGLAIKLLHNRRSGYMNLAYCDDHTLMGRLGSFRALAANVVLRRAMVLMLGTNACNEEKFTIWAFQCKALGLIFCLQSMTVSMPAAKISKILGRLSELLSANLATLKLMRRTLGLLRYLGMCIPIAKPFYNRLQAFMGVLENVSKPLKLPASAKEDTRWLIALFSSDAFQAISMRRLAGAIEPHETINMDASDLGVCAVWHSQKLYFAIEWNDEEKALIKSFKNKDDMSFSINYRELLGAYFAMIIWSKAWSRTYGKEAHIRFAIDNMSAVSWSDTRNTKHAGAQAALRLMGLMEAALHIMTSSEHIAGVLNVWPDSGSRMWASASALSSFQSMSIDYVQVAVPEKWRCPSKAWSSFTKAGLSQETVMELMGGIGGSGSIGAR